MITSKNELSIENFIKVRNTTNLMVYEKEDVELALKNSIYCVSIYDDDKVIGIGRIIGDDRIAFIIKDVVVIPEYRGMHIGDQIMKNLLNYIHSKASKNAYIGLMSTPGKEEFYEKYGFIRRPSKNFGSGMVMFYDK